MCSRVTGGKRSSASAELEVCAEVGSIAGIFLSLEKQLMRGCKEEDGS